MSNGEHITVWEECLRIIAQNVEPQQFKTWFQPIRPVSLEGSRLTIEVPTDYYRDYIEDAFIDIVSKTVFRVLGKDARLMYVTKPVQQSQAMMTSPSEIAAPDNRPVSVNTFQPAGSPNPFVYPGLRRIRIPSRLNPVYRFSNLVEGECNHLGITAGTDIADKPGKTPFNPLFIFGGPGLGKTHLAQAIGISILEKYPDLVVLYVTGNEFKTQYMEATGVNNKLNDFLAFYMKIDVLIVDDIQEMHGAATMTAFFNIFNHLHQNGKQLILTSDRPPKDLQGFELRMQQRFKWGLCVELERPDYETRLSMLHSKCLRDGITDISEDTLEYLALNVKNNFRELEGALVSMNFRAINSHTGFSIPLARKVVEQIVGEQAAELSIDAVQGSVCEYFGITREDLVSTSRKRQFVQARQISMYLCREYVSGASLVAIGAATGGKDHSTVLHSCSTVSDLMSTDKVFRKYVSDLERLLGPASNN